MTPHPKPHWGIQGQSFPHCNYTGHLSQGPLQPCSDLPPPAPRVPVQPWPSWYQGTPILSTVCPTQGLHLLIGSAPPSDQHHVEAGEADDRDEEEASHTHDSHAGPLRPTAMGEDTEQVPADKLPTHPGRATHPVWIHRQLTHPSEPWLAL